MASRTAPHPTHGGPIHGVPTLDVVLAGITADEAIPVRRRQDTASALRALAKALDRPLDTVPAHPGYLAEALKGFAPAMAGFTVPRWRNIMSLVRSALAHAGLAHVPGRYRQPRAPEWTHLTRQLKDAGLQRGLSKFTRWCSTHGILPGQVDDQTLAAFKNDLLTAGIEKNGRRVHRTACIAWNKAASTVPSWPQQRLTVPDNRRDYAVAWAAFPPSLKDEIDRYLDRLAGKDRLETLRFRPVRPATIVTRRKQLHEYVSALVHRGHAPATLRSLKDVVGVETVKDAARFFLDRSGGEPSVQLGNIVGVITAVARHWVKVDPEHLDELKALGRRVTPASQGLTAKNTALLRQFDDPRNVRALVTLPQIIHKEAAANKKPLSRKQALLVQTAVAIELLLMKPIRIKNLVNLEIGKHLIRHRKGAVHLAITTPEIKNGVAAEAIFSGETVRLIDFYIDRCLPVLRSTPSTWLFPGEGGKAKSTDAMRDQIAKCCWRRCGLRVNPHLFRHITAKIYLTAHPGGYEVVRLLHGHKSVDTTTRFYCGTEGIAAAEHFDREILKWREPVAGSRKAGRKGSPNSRTLGGLA